MSYITVLERVMLRGIQGELEDAYLRQVLENKDTDGLQNVYEAKYMAQQIFASWKGWGL